MAKVSNKDIYNQDDNLSMEDYLLGTNNNTINKKTQTYSLGSIFSLFYNFLGYNAFLFTTDTDTYPIASPGCFFAFDEHNQITSNFQQARKLTFSSNDTYNFNVTEYLQMLVDSDKFLFKLINLEDKNNFIFLKPRNFTLSNTLTSFDVNIEIQYGLSNGNFVNYKKYLLLLEFDANTFDPADYDLTDFTNTSGNPFITEQDLTNALSLLPTPISSHSELNLDDGTNPHGTTKSDVGLSDVPNLDTTNAVNNSHTHSNKSILDSITEPFTTSLKSLYDGAVTNIDNLLLTGQRLITSGEITKLSNTSGTNTGDETTSSIQTKRPLKTIEGQSLEGTGNITLNNKLDKVTTGSVRRVYAVDASNNQEMIEVSELGGGDFKKKIENTRYKSTLTGENIIIPFQAAGQSHYIVSNATLVSVAGFTTAGLTTPMYEGQDVIFENQTGHEITLKDSFGVDTSFVIGADLIVPNEGKIWFRFRNNELELIDKNWFKINEVATAQNLGEFIHSLDSKTDVKDTDEFILSDSDDGLKSKKTRFLDLKTKLKSYFDNFYLSLSIFNDFAEHVFNTLDDKLYKSTTPSSVYATDAEGLQVMKPISEFQPVGDYVTVNTTQTVTGNKTFNNVPLIKKTNTSVYPHVSGGLYMIGPNGSYDTFEFYSFAGTDQDSFGTVRINSNPEEGNTIYQVSLDGQDASYLNVKKFDLSLVNVFAGQRTALYVDGENKKIKIEGTQNKFAALGTSLITGTKNFEFPNQSGTLALLSDLTDTQNALNLKLPIESPSTTGTVISFTVDKVYGTLTTPETGNITADFTNAKLGVTNIIIHNSATAPTFGSEFKKLSGSGNYVTGVVNYIYCTYISTTEIIYSINQRA